MSAGDGRAIELRIRISPRGGGSARCSGSRVWGQPEVSFHEHRPLTSNAISPQQERTERFAPQRWTCGGRQSRRPTIPEPPTLRAPARQCDKACAETMPRNSTFGCTMRIDVAISNSPFCPGIPSRSRSDSPCDHRNLEQWPDRRTGQSAKSAHGPCAAAPVSNCCGKHAAHPPNRAARRLRRSLNLEIESPLSPAATSAVAIRDDRCLHNRIGKLNIENRRLPRRRAGRNFGLPFDRQARFTTAVEFGSFCNGPASHPSEQRGASDILGPRDAFVRRDRVQTGRFGARRSRS